MLTAVIIILLILSVFLLMRARDGMAGAMPVALGVFLLALGLSIWNLAKSNRDLTVSFEQKGYQGAGAVLGRAVVEAIPAGGEVLVIQLPDITMGQSQVPQRQRDGLKDALGKKYTLTGMDRDDATLGEAFNRAMTERAFTPELAAALLAKHPGAVAAVSFIGLPGNTPEGVWPAGAPPLFAMGSWADKDKEAWMKSVQLKALVVPRRDDQGGAAVSASNSEAYDTLYERVK